MSVNSTGVSPIPDSQVQPPATETGPSNKPLVQQQTAAIAQAAFKQQPTLVHLPFPPKFLQDMGHQYNSSSTGPVAGLPLPASLPSLLPPLSIMALAHRAQVHSQQPIPSQPSLLPPGLCRTTDIVAAPISKPPAANQRPNPLEQLQPPRAVSSPPVLPISVSQPLRLDPDERDYKQGASAESPPWEALEFLSDLANMPEADLRENGETLITERGAKIISSSSERSSNTRFNQEDLKLLSALHQQLKNNQISFRWFKDCLFPIACDLSRRYEPLTDPCLGKTVGEWLEWGAAIARDPDYWKRASASTPYPDNIRALPFHKELPKFILTGNKNPDKAMSFITDLVRLSNHPLSPHIKFTVFDLISDAWLTAALGQNSSLFQEKLSFHELCNHCKSFLGVSKHQENKLLDEILKRISASPQG